MSATPLRQTVDFTELYRRLEEMERSLERDQSPSEEHKARVLQQRASLVARVAARPALEGIPVFTFTLGSARFAVPLERVQHVADGAGLGALLGAPRGVLGALSSRGLVVPVLDLRAVLSLQGGLSDLRYVLVVRDARGVQFGLAAHTVEGRLDVPPEGLRPPAVAGPFLGMAQESLPILDVDLLAAQENGVS